MRYMLMICTDENAVGALSPEEGSAVEAEFAAFDVEMDRRGVLLGGDRLRPTTDATTVRVRDGEALVADGPFVETKEQVGGYYLVDCSDLDEAIEVASKIPAARYGTAGSASVTSLIPRATRTSAAMGSWSPAPRNAPDRGPAPPGWGTCGWVT
jgi:hypothetical protein